MIETETPRNTEGEKPSRRRPRKGALAGVSPLRKRGVKHRRGEGHASPVSRCFGLTVTAPKHRETPRNTEKLMYGERRWITNAAPSPRAPRPVLSAMRHFRPFAEREAKAAVGWASGVPRGSLHTSRNFHYGKCRPNEINGLGKNLARK